MRAGIIAAAFAVALAGGAAAQDGAADEATLRAEQAQLFTAMFDAPEDLDLMFRYALVSIRLKDYEAAITTLERMLIYRPDQPAVRAELGASYFRIGSYPVAREYFRQIADDPAAPAELKARADQFIAEIERRSRASYWTGRVFAGGIFSTNANNGPDSTTIEFLGVPAQLADPDATSQTDGGATVTAQATWVQDIGGPLGEEWRTDFAFYGVRYAEIDEGNVEALLIRTGPRLAFDDRRDGIKGRPYLEFDHVRYGKNSLHTTFGFGFDLTAPLMADTIGFADARIGWRDNHESTAGVDKDGANFRMRAGLSHLATERVSLLGYGVLEYEGAETQSERNFTVGLGGAATVSYDSGFEMASRPWAVELTARGIVRRFDEPGIFDPANEREDFDLRVSIGHTAYLEQGFAAVAKAEYLLRESDIRTFDLDALTVTAGIEYRF